MMANGFGLSLLSSKKLTQLELQTAIDTLYHQETGKPEQSEGKDYLLKREDKSDDQMADSIVSAFQSNNLIARRLLKTIVPKNRWDNFRYQGTQLESFVDQLRQGNINGSPIGNLKDFMQSTCGVSVLFGLIIAVNTLQQLSDSQGKQVDVINNSENIEKIFYYILNEIGKAEKSSDIATKVAIIIMAMVFTSELFIPAIQAVIVK